MESMLNILGAIVKHAQQICDKGLVFLLSAHHHARSLTVGKGEMAKLICVECGHSGKPVTRVPGSIVLELILWLCFVVPGMIYSVWRHNKKFKACAVCGASHLIPINSPKGRRLYAEYEQQSGSSEVSQRPSLGSALASTGMGQSVGRFWRSIQR